MITGSFCKSMSLRARQGKKKQIITNLAYFLMKLLFWLLCISTHADISFGTGEVTGYPDKTTL
jgi:hypothetical protein